MADKIVDVTGIGNAIVDVIAPVPNDFMAENGLAGGAMTLVDAERSDRLLELVGPTQQVSGGSAANTVVGLAEFGGRGAFVGKIRDDALGQAFVQDLSATGVRFATAPSTSGPATARCLVMVTGDGQRSMATYLGACMELGPEDIDESMIAASRITYLEGYLWDPPRAKQAFRRAAGIAAATGGRIALTLSDPFCVDRHRAEFLELLTHDVDILFANESELMSLFRCDTLDAAIAALAGRCAVAVVTRGARGSIVLTGSGACDIAAEPVADVVDTTGAGDLYAAGFLFGLARALPPPACGRLGAIAAAEIISHPGARPKADLASLAPSRAGVEPFAWFGEHSACRHSTLS